MMLALDPKDLLGLLHDHYNDTFAHIRDREQRRDRLFVVLALMFVLLVLQVQYPATVGGSLGTISLAGVELSVRDLPLAALLDVTWLLTLLVGLKYCQTALAVERQYPYLHRLEEQIATRLGDPELFCREGKSYLHAYPSVLNWAWFCYVILFPLAVVLGTTLLTVVMWRDLDYSGWHKAFASGMAAALVVSFALYQVVPRLSQVVLWLRQRKN
jgi:uncharacterized membrane protein YhaH (DUF805 family)